MKGTKLLAFLLAFVMTFSSIGIVDVSAAEVSTEERLSGQSDDVSVQVLVRGEERDYNWIYEDETLVVDIASNAPEGSVTEVSIGRVVELEEGYAFESYENNGLFDFDVQNSQATLYGPALAETLREMGESGLGFHVNVKDSEAEDAEQLFDGTWWFEVVKPHIEYDYPCSFPGDDTMLVGETIYISPSMGSWGESKEYPNGTEQQATITEVSVSETQYSYIQEQEGSYNIISVTGNEQDGWELRGNDHGEAEVTITYKDWFHGEEEQSYSFRVFSVGDYFVLRMNYPNDSGEMLRGESREIGTTLIRRFLNGEERLEENYENYELEFLVDREDGEGQEYVKEYETPSMTFSVGEDGKTVNVQAAEDYYGPYSIDVRAKGQYDDWSFEANTKLDMRVASGYFVILADGPENVAVGDTIHMADYVEAWHHKEGVESYNLLTKGEDYSISPYDFRFRLEYNDNVWSPVEDDDMTNDHAPALKRISNDYGEIRVFLQYAEPDTDEWMDCGVSRGWGFDSLDYSLGLDGLSEGDHGRIFTSDEVVELFVNTENLKNKDLETTEVSIGVWDGEAEEFISFEEEPLYDQCYEACYEDGVLSSVKLYPAKLQELKEEGKFRDDDWFDLQIIVKSGDIEVWDSTWGIGLYDEEVNYFYHERIDDRSMLPGWEDGFSADLRCEVVNGEFPHGTEKWVAIKNVELEILEGDENAFWIQPFEDGTGWNYGANSFGHAVLTLTHESATGGEDIVREVHLWSGTDVWEMSVSYDTATDHVLPGNHLNVFANISRHCYSEEEGHFEGWANVEFEWGFQESEGFEYQGLGIEPDGDVLHVWADENAEPGMGAELWVKAYLLDDYGNRLQDNGEDIEVVRHHFYIHIEHDYLVIEEIWENIGTDRGGMVYMNPVLKSYSMEDGIRDITEDMRFVWEWDDNALEAVEGIVFDEETNQWYSCPGQEVSFQLLERCDWDNGIAVIAQLKDEEGNYFEVNRRHCEVRLYDLRLNYPDRGHIYENETLELGVVARNLGYADGADLEASIGLWQEDTFVPFENQSDLFDFYCDYTGGALILNGAAIAEFRELMDDEGRFFIKIDAVEDENVICSRSFDFHLAESHVEYKYGDIGAEDQSMLVNWGRGLGRELWYSADNAEYPHGTEGTVEIISAKLQQLEGEPDAFWFEEDEEGNGWHYGANDYGTAMITITHRGVDGQPVEHSFRVYSGENVWELYLNEDDFANGWMRPGESIKITTELWKESYTREEGYSFTDTHDNVYYEWGYCGENRDDLLEISFDEKNPGVLNVKAKDDLNLENDQNIEIWIRAYEVTEYGVYEVAYRSTWIGVSEWVNEVTVADFDSAYEVGDTFTLEPTLLFRTPENPEGEVCTDSTLRFEYDFDDSVFMKNMDGDKATFTRGGDWRSEITVIAYLSNEFGEYEAGRCQLVLERKDYEVSFENSRGENHTWVFDNEEACELLVDASNLSELNKEHLEYIWEVGQFDENGWLTKTAAEGEDYVIYAAGSGMYKVVLNGVQLSEHEFYDGFEVRLKVNYQGTQIVETGIWISMETPQFEIYNDGFNTLTGNIGGWYYPYNKVWAYVKDANYPAGGDVEFDIENLEVVSVDEQEDIFRVTTEVDPEIGEYWRITPQSIGQQEILFELQDPKNADARYEKTYELFSGEEIYAVVVDEGIEYMSMLPESSQKLQVKVYQLTLDEEDDTKIVPTLLPEDRYTLFFESHDKNLLKVSKYGKVTTRTNAGETAVTVRAEVRMLDGESIYESWRDISVNIVPSRIFMETQTLYAEPGELVNIKDISADIYKETYHADGDVTTERYEPKNMKFTAVNEEEIFQIAWLGKKLIVNDEITPYEGESFPIERWVYIRGTHGGAEYTSAVQLKICEKHNYETVVKPATTTANGYTSEICSKCGHEMNKQTVYKASSVKLSANSYIYNGSAKKPTVTVKDSQGKVISSDHYTVTYATGRTDVGTYNVTVKFKGSYSGSKTLSFKISPKEIAPTVKLSATSYVYNGSARKPTVTVTDGSTGKKLTSGTDYNVTYATGRIKAGTYKVTVNLTGNYSGSKEVSFTIKAKEITPVVKLSATSYVYNGSARKPTVTVTDDAAGKKLTSGTDYTVTYATGRTNVGKYSVKVTLKGNYKGNKTVYFTINPKVTTISSVTAASKAFTVKWNKVSTQTTGYQIQYSTKSSFDGAKSITITSSSTVSKKVSSLTAKKKYYVRVRTYKTVDGTKYYSAWSAVKNITTK